MDKDKSSTIWLIIVILLAIAFTVFVSVVAWRNYHKEDFQYDVLKNSIGMASGSNILINLDQVFGFFGGLSSETPLPLNTSDCFCNTFNDKDKLVLLGNYVYQYHTGYITNDEFSQRVNTLGGDFSNWREHFNLCKRQCEKDKGSRQVPRLFNHDQILGFLTGTIISESKDMMYPCYELIANVRDFLYHNDEIKVSEYINLDLSIKGGVCTKEYAETKLKSLNIDTVKLQESLKSYCEQWCDSKLC